VVFLGWVKHPYVQLSSPGRQKGQRLGSRNGQIHGGFMADLWRIQGFDTYKGAVRVGFININDMYNNDVGKGVVYD